MDKTTKELVVWVTTMLGHAMLWGSLIIGFLDWSYSMGFFRTSIMGLTLLGASKYLKIEWDLDE